MSAGPDAIPPTAPPTAPPGLPAWQRRLLAAWERRDGLSQALAPIGWVVGRVASLRRWAFGRGWLRSHPLEVPVVVVGNLVVGGAGKTPTTLALVDALRRAGHRPGIVSRGHGRQGQAPIEVTPETPVALAGDEPLLMRRRAGVPVVVGRDRLAAGLQLLRSHPRLTVVVADDGLQHRRLARRLEVVVFDERGLGNGRCLPAGPLREPLPARRPAITVVVYNADTPTTPWAGERLQRRVDRLVPLAAWWSDAPDGGEDWRPLLQSPRLYAVAGVARPGRFFQALEALGLRFEALALPDHHAFDTLPWPADAPDVVVTEKDAVKLRPDAVGRARVWVAPLDCSLHPDTVRAVLDALPPP